MYDRHPSLRLNRAFKGYQGQDPRFAKYIFFGLDANFAFDIEQSPIFNEVIEYLTDGVGYWERRNRHHPFLSSAYKKGSGYRYHYQFSKLGLSSEYADKVSFVELLDCPTYGKTSMNRLMALLNIHHLRIIDKALFSANGDRVVFIARGVYSRLHDIGKSVGCFACLPESREFQLNKLYTVLDRVDLKIYVITHFSDSISDGHLAEIRRTIQG